jgi:hypothetical protein
MRKAERALMGVIGWVIVAVVAIGAVAAVFGWDRYRGSRNATRESSQPTSEVFTDPASGKPMRVWYDPTTGEREYRPE